MTDHRKTPFTPKYRTLKVCSIDKVLVAGPDICSNETRTTNSGRPAVDAFEIEGCVEKLSLSCG